MALISDRINTWVEDRITAWKERLRGWAISVISLGVEAFFNILGKSIAKKLKPAIDKIEANVEIPPELKPIFEELKNPTGESAASIGHSFTGSLVSGAIGTLTDWLLRPLITGLSNAPHFHLPKPEILIALRQHNVITLDNYHSSMRGHGIPPEHSDLLLYLASPRFPSEVVGPLWLRDKEKYGVWWADVEQLGLAPERIEILKELAHRIPMVQDIIRYVVKEVYNPEVYKAFGQDQEYPEVAEKDALMAGVRPDYLLKEWIAHWVLPSSGQGFDLLHRGEITEDELDKLLKALDIMPFWREKLTALSWDVPNRIELRMLARYGLVDKEFLLTALKNVGLREDYRDILADLMLAQGMMTDLSKRYSNKWINSDEVKAELKASGMSQIIQDRIYSWVIKNAGPERTASQRQLTEALVVKGVKKGDLTWDEGVERLMAMNYNEEEANLRMAIDIEVVEAEPTSELTVRTDTIRRQRRQRLINRDQEIASLLDLGLEVGLATAYADNDDLRLAKETAGG
jgi:hypothetical protein